MSSIFICYRRGSSSGWAGRLSQALRSAFGDTSVFMDIEALAPGADFVIALENALRSCDCFLSLIGPDWVSITDEAGRRRLDDPHDFVRLELSTALQRNVDVIPVLVGGARIPKAEELPEPLVDLTRRQVHELTDTRWDYDCQNLIYAIKHTTPKQERSKKRTRRLAAALVTLSVAGLAFFGYLYFPYILRSKSFIVAANQPWQDTKFSVRRGEKLTIIYE